MIPRALLAVALGACAQAASRVADVPIAFGRWRPPEGQSCYVDALQPPELPALSAVLDSAAVVAALRERAPGEVLITLAFDSSGRSQRVRVIDRRMSAATADWVRTVVVSRRPRIGSSAARGRRPVLHARASRRPWPAGLRATPPV
jgi:hypothetical protein